MKVIVFELAKGRYSLELSCIGRVIAPPERGEPAAGVVDLGRLLELAAIPPLGDSEQGHRVAFDNGGVEVRMGRPLGTASVEPEWILPLPGYIFKGRRGLFRGIILPPGEEGSPAAGISRLSLLLSHEYLAAERA